MHGGGGVDPGLRPRLLEMVGGSRARVLVVPQASAAVDNWPSLPEVWRKIGAGSAELLDLSSPGDAAAQVERADFVWLAAGDQSRLAAVLAGTPAADALRRRYHEGLVIGGISAGMAVMSAVMITGEPADPVSGATHVGAGLGLWPEVILDQHVLARQRLDRLVRAVADHPGLVGIGVDESTSIVVEQGRRFVVEGESQVVVVRARDGVVETTAIGPGGSHELA